MKITLLALGKTDENYLNQGIDLYVKRIKHYVSFELVELPALKKTAGMSPEMVKQKEAEMIAKYTSRADCIILLDEKGLEFTSVGFADFLQKRMNSGIKEALFVVGGAWGFSEGVYKQAQFKVSLSKMTFSHQMVRLFFVEQLYRGFSILKGENYHNE